jgi:hypothetical protein
MRLFWLNTLHELRSDVAEVYDFVWTYLYSSSSELFLFESA